MSSGPYQCAKCYKKFTLQGNLKRHLKEKHDKTYKRYRYRCKICQKPYPTVAKLRDHSQKRHEDAGEIGKDAEYVCDICLKVFKYRNTIVDHLRYAHDRGNRARVLFTCQFCKRKFNRKCNLEYHIQHSACSRNPNPDTRRRVICYKCGTPTLEKHIKLHLKRYCAGVPLSTKNKLNSENKKSKEERTIQCTEIYKQNDAHTKNIKKTITVRELRRLQSNKVSESKDQEQITLNEGYRQASIPYRTLRKRTQVDYKTLDDPYADSVRKLKESSQIEVATPHNFSDPLFNNETVIITVSAVKPSLVDIEGLGGHLKVEPGEESDYLVKGNTESIFEVNYMGLSQAEEILHSIKQESEADKDFNGDWCVPRQDEVVMKADVEDYDVLQDTSAADEGNGVPYRSYNLTGLS